MELSDLFGENVAVDSDGIRISWQDLEEATGLTSQNPISVAVAIIYLLYQTVDAAQIDLMEVLPLESDLQVFAPVVRNDESRTQFTFNFSIYGPYQQPVLNPDEVS